MKKTTFILLFVIACSLTYAEANDWPCWRGVNRDGKSKDTALLKEWPEAGPELKWELNALGKGFSSVSLGNDSIYTTGDIEDKLFLFAIDMKGDVKWKVPVDTNWKKSFPGSRSTPTFDDDKLYVLSGHGKIVCFDAQNGTEIWSKNLQDMGGKSGGWGYSESVLVYKDLAIVKPGGANCITAFNKESGDIVWKSEGFDAGPEYSSCVPFTYQGISMIVTGTHMGIFCVAADSGKLLWSNDWCAENVANCPDPVYSDGHVFWSNGYEKGGICLKLSVNSGVVTAQEAWTTQEMVCHIGGYIIHQGYVYGNHDDEWVCLELETGQKMWDSKGVGKGSICYADEMLYLFSENKGKAGLATCSPKGMDMRGMFQVEGTDESWACPVVTGGRLYLRYANNLYCYNVSAKPAI
jgi:outer membrane protein assembly factor BamB